MNRRIRLTRCRSVSLFRHFSKVPASQLVLEYIDDQNLLGEISNVVVVVKPLSGVITDENNISRSQTLINSLLSLKVPIHGLRHTNIYENSTIYPMGLQSLYETPCSNLLLAVYGHITLALVGFFAVNLYED